MNHQLIFTESSLTVDNLVGVMEKMTSGKENRRKVWEAVLEWEEFIPSYLFDMVDRKKTTEKEKQSILAGVYIDVRPESSWKHLVSFLYDNGELAAAKEAKSFLQNGV